MLKYYNKILRIFSDEHYLLHDLLGLARDYPSFYTATPPHEDCMQADCDLQSKYKNRKRKG